ncbi:StAR-related lipid transfer protein 3 [Eumeta japonica]|uniref:StAR-related lipid transfer protein 3 n=1 Tax=Eumeta variegata TaxID=151549 RepID=A0A4C1WDV8_EUMVA|nr:StAR-related lipid transfer protein 3 [Eumeta japonica]
MKINSRVIHAIDRRLLSVVIREKVPGVSGWAKPTQIDEYMAKAEESVHVAWKVMSRSDWKMEKRGAVRGDVVETLQLEGYGKVYKFTGIVDCPAKFLFAEFRDNLTRLPEWNPTILKTELIKVVGPGVDLSYQVTAGGGRGVVAPRDFVILRRTAALANDGAVVPTDGEPYAFITSGVSVEVPGYPPLKEYVRGQNKIGCWIMKPTVVKTSSGRLEEKCTFHWIMCCDLKGKIPQFVLDTAFATVMMDYMVHVRQFAAASKSKGLF